jgi:transposase
MPWKVEKVETQRGQFVLKVLEPGANFSEICREHGISRPTGYKWLARYQEHGISALSDESRKPKKFKNPTKPELIIEIVNVRNDHPTWGGKKIRAHLKRRKFKKVPAARTIDRILKRCGLVKAKSTLNRIKSGRSTSKVGGLQKMGHAANH